MSFFEADVPPEILADRPDAVAFTNIAILPVQLRFNGLRTTMFAFALSLADDEDVRGHALKSMERALATYALIEDVVMTNKPMPQVHRAALEWMRDVVRNGGQDLSGVRQMHVICTEHFNQIKNGTPLTGEQVEDLMRFSYGSFHNSVVGLVDLLREAHADREAEQRQAAEDAQSKARNAAEKIDGITRTVRLISLNAAVEAARAGDAGRGFSVIAQEIKALSEKAEVAGKEVQSGINNIMVSTRS